MGAPELEHRVTVVERSIDELADMNGEALAIAELAGTEAVAARQAHHQGIKLLNALRSTQVEHGGVLAEHTRHLKEHSRQLGAIRKTQVEQGGLLAEHGGLLAEHSRQLDDHSRQLDDVRSTQVHHTEVLDQHTEVLNQHTEVLNQHTDTLSTIESLLRTHFNDPVDG